MDSVPCMGCGNFFYFRNKLQTYCSGPICQKKRKALWQRQKLKNDPEYREIQALSNKKWLENNPDYWKIYRRKNPAKTNRNRLLQRIRNRNKNNLQDSPQVKIIAKMDSRT